MDFFRTDTCVLFIGIFHKSYEVPFDIYDTCQFLVFGYLITIIRLEKFILVTRYFPIVSAISIGSSFVIILLS